MEEAFLCREKLTQEDFCVIYSEILCRSELTLKLLSLNITAIEKNCSLDAVLSFRQAEEKISTVLLGVFRKAQALDTGIKVTGDADSIDVELHIVITYGMNINAIAASITEKVKYTVKEITGITVNKVSVMVDGIKE